MNFGEKLKKIRNEREMTQKEMADFLNVSVQTISNWESGRRSPHPELYTTIANTLGIELEQIAPDNFDQKTLDRMKKMSEGFKPEDTQKRTVLTESFLFYSLFMVILFTAIVLVNVYTLLSTRDLIIEIIRYISLIPLFLFLSIMIRKDYSVRKYCCLSIVIWTMPFVIPVLVSYIRWLIAGVCPLWIFIYQVALYCIFPVTGNLFSLCFFLKSQKAILFSGSIVYYFVYPLIETINFMAVITHHTAVYTDMSLFYNYMVMLSLWLICLSLMYESFIMMKTSTGKNNHE